jgi:integrase
VASENTGTGRSRPRQPASGNTGPSGTGRRGARPTALPAGPAGVLERYAAALAGVPLAEETKRTYLSRVRMYLAWLASPAAARRLGGDPLADPRARDWAVRDYRHWLLREADPKRSARYANNALAALDDFYTRLGLGKADVARDDLPQIAPKALGRNAQLRWLRAVEDWPSPRNRLLALLPFYAGLRIGDAVALDVADIQMSARKGHLIVSGRGGKVRQVPIHPQLRTPLTGLARRTASLEERRRRAGAIPQPPRRPAVGPGASAVFTAIGSAAGLDDHITAHTGRHTFVTQLIRGGEDLVTVAEIAGHSRLDTLRIYSRPTDDDKHNALRHLTVDR